MISQCLYNFGFIISEKFGGHNNKDKDDLTYLIMIKHILPVYMSTFKLFQQIIVVIYYRADGNEIQGLVFNYE